jgi:hypothetical protein
VRLGEVRLVEVCPGEVCPGEACPGEVRLGELRLGEIRLDPKTIPCPPPVPTFYPSVKNIKVSFVCHTVQFPLCHLHFDYTPTLGRRKRLILSNLD